MADADSHHGSTVVRQGGLTFLPMWPPRPWHHVCMPAQAASHATCSCMQMFQPAHRLKAVSPCAPQVAG